MSIAGVSKRKRAVREIQSFTAVLIGVIGICVLGLLIFQITKRFSSMDIEIII